jgi:hypothetical protein
MAYPKGRVGKDIGMEIQNNLFNQPLLNSCVPKRSAALNTGSIHAHKDCASFQKFNTIRSLINFM